MKGGGNGGNRTQSSSVARSDRVAPRGSTSGRGEGANRVYAITSRQGLSLYFMTTYIAMNFDILLEQFLETFSVSTPIGESILVEVWTDFIPVML
ncbi:hypothetical protein H5410_020983 [Solanum commersonii]|uniref:Uncharacterized protein n=1 Tax=Solanum commersonii TaxID=4109 RepID=A0A9J5ZFU0_SOLCO|nr:hypothetical protein H5410_020983 [Solanum commersonii]